MTGLPNEFDPRGIRLQVLKENELGLMSLALNFELIEEWKRSCVLVVVFLFSTHRDIFRQCEKLLVSTRAAETSEMAIFLFIFSAGDKI